MHLKIFTGTHAMIQDDFNLWMGLFDEPPTIVRVDVVVGRFPYMFVIWSGGAAKPDQWEAVLSTVEEPMTREHKERTGQ